MAEPKKMTRMTTNINPLGTPEHAAEFHKNLKRKLGQDKPQPDSQELENDVREFTPASGSFAIVDAALLKDLDSPLAKEAVIIPVKSDKVAFEIKMDYDDTTLRSVSISPKASPEPDAIAEPGHEDHHEEGMPAEVTPPEEVSEGLSPLSHDSSPERAIRKHKTPRSRRHMDGSDRYRLKDPAKKIMAKIKRTSHGQPRPEVHEVLEFIKNYSGKPIAEDQITAVKNLHLLVEVMDMLYAMACMDWEMTESGISNGQCVIEDDRFAVDNQGQLLFGGKILPLNFDWIHETRQLAKKIATKKAWDYRG